LFGRTLAERAAKARRGVFYEHRLEMYRNPEFGAANVLTSLKEGSILFVGEIT
jgi:hypothetical protein